jgi:uncharacterized membrane protein
MRALVRGLGAALVVLYPALVYFGLSRMSVRAFGIALAAVVLISLPLRFQGKREHIAVIARVPLTIVAMLLIAACFDDRRFVLALPVITNVILLMHFGASLRTVPIAERFARMQEADLSDAQIAYCRRVTQVWCLFFIMNGAVIAMLAVFAPLGWWTLYTSLVSYFFVGALATVEYVIRKYRFRKYGENVIDRVLIRIFPPRETMERGARG